MVAPHDGDLGQRAAVALADAARPRASAAAGPPLLAAPVRPPRLALAEGDARRRGRLRGVPLRRDPRARRGRRRGDPARRRALVHPVVSGRRGRRARPDARRRMTRAFRAARATALVAAAVPAILAPPAGGAITIRLDAETTVAAAATTLRLTATNAGGETARHIAPEVTWLDRPRPAEAVAALDPGGRQRWDLALPPAPAAGAFPLVIRVRYADANGYPLSALLVHLVRTPGAPAGPVRAGLVAGPVTTFGTARLRLEDPGPRARSEEH